MTTELLTAVLGKDIYGWQFSPSEDNTLEYGYGYGMPVAINIYELMYLMKEWATDTALVGSIGSGYCSTRNSYWCIFNNDNNQYYDTTEFEAVTQACEWLLTNKDNQ